MSLRLFLTVYLILQHHKLATDELEKLLSKWEPIAAHLRGAKYVEVFLIVEDVLQEVEIANAETV